ncbi:MAG: HAMP domain-containing sensor histidine kinase [Candidatus Saccharicenans sp.]|jgi:signal transduction histidine kinase|nr:HAMP domain-containing histidine kinase [Candidatus Saccharicenans sp.]MDH7574739.1 HAMP domain-containing sensor histidine kinase [Candidatus Saccharicenans sp.]
MRKSEIWAFFLLPYVLVLGLFSLVSYLNRQAIQSGVETLAKEQLQATASILKENIKELLDRNETPARILEKFSGLEDVYFIALLDEKERILDWHSKFEGYLPFSRRDRPAAEFWVMDSPLGSVFNHYSSLSTSDGRIYNLYLGYSLQNLDLLLVRSRRNFWLVLGLLAVAGLVIFAGIYRLHDNFQRARGEAIKQAEEKERFREISGFTAGVAHEIKNPLNSLALLFELLEKKSPAELGPQISRGKGEIQKIGTVVDRFSELIKPLSLQRGKFSFYDVVRGEADNLQALAQERGVTIELRVPASLEVEGDRLLLSRVVNNLVKNALEASGAGQKVTVEAGLRKQALIFSVKDEGRGIKPEDSEKIFEPFVSFKETGLGVGLYLVRKIVEAHRGKIYLRSRPGAGTEFSVELPGGQNG